MSKHSNLCEKIKKYINDTIETDEINLFTFSIDLSKKFNRKYTFLTKIFLNEYGISIRTYVNNVKVERIKKLIDEDIEIGEISVKMHYCSSSHLSHQFKLKTKMTPTQYRNLTKTQIDSITLEFLKKITL